MLYEYFWLLVHTVLNNYWTVLMADGSGGDLTSLQSIMNYLNYVLLLLSDLYTNNYVVSLFISCACILLN